ncbi:MULTISPECIES: hybrid sensor histidine kinase/response regulator [unclassified Tolypothrix]|uniref:hybrid sensor histidine kinase/response regulator n=1 Tax=unclassified Tolypothrix TaxID=2649714 RepID=UPI0005EAC439|nr:MULTISPECIES: ATP-binding protein [unclassified Tolypothrix]BAY95438.1 response regulator receiver sensor signal transduction histidine kinase [Microchaete diplosiphon NIES-3275]EKF00681.1 sensor histidine kinase [Tolypothrix sp. PCC 7601]MBE9087577.1 response regulator [Tolypothrix sp. LEGE 11397]UYD28656.1 response regulator [Tolypothrix sp. PCC 7712]UYD35431.1 response regulator [Tolypothrix sp. PCC 7601]
MQEKILVVEDEIIIACDIKSCLEKAGYIVPAIAAHGKQAVEKAAEIHPDLILMDVMLKGDMSGIEAAAEIGHLFNIPVIYLTAYSDQTHLQKAKTTQPFGYILKPFEETQLITTIEIALNKHQIEVVMREALEKEKENRAIKNKFVSMVSHEFRNPLNNILTCTELLSDYSLHANDEKRHEYISHIQKSVKHLDNLLTDVLLISKDEPEKLQFNPAPIDLEDFCQDLLQDIQLNASENHKIIFTVHGRLANIHNNLSMPDSHLIKLDAKMLYHILSNLLANAIKYSPLGGTISFDVFYVSGEVIFRIQDEGIGIPEADQENLFNSFHRGSNVGNIPGNGLGLAIVKYYIDLHGGNISFASKPGIGTTFIVNLPINN